MRALLGRRRRKHGCLDQLLKWQPLLPYLTPLSKAFLQGLLPRRWQEHIYRSGRNVLPHILGILRALRGFMKVGFFPQAGLLWNDLQANCSPEYYGGAGNWNKRKESQRVPQDTWNKSGSLPNTLAKDSNGKKFDIPSVFTSKHRESQ